MSISTSLTAAGGSFTTHRGDTFHVVRISENQPYMYMCREADSRAPACRGPMHDILQHMDPDHGSYIEFCISLGAYPAQR